MAETGDAGVAAGEIAPSIALRPQHQLDMIAGRIAEPDEALHLALLGLLRGSSMYRVAKRFQRRRRVLQAGFVLHLETDGLVARIALRIAQRVRALVGPQIQGRSAPLGDLEAQAGGGKALGLLQIR